MNATKLLLRGELRQAVARLSAEERAAFSSQLCQRLRGLPVWRAARSVLAFAPLPGEPDLMSLVEEALGEGRSISFLRFDAEADAYEPCQVRGLGELVPGRFGVEPSADCPKFSANQLDLALVPGIGFSLDGDRLGRGKGYYDRLLSVVTGFKCGVAFDCQVVDALPVEPHDIRLNGILTPTRWQPI